MKLSMLLTVILLAAAAAAQDEPTFRLNVDVDLVEVHVTVLDERDRPVSGLQEQHFRVLEDQVEQQIAVFRYEDIPISLGLVIDNSRSIEPRKERLDAGALAFVRNSNPVDETFIIHFDDRARLEQDFTSSMQELEETLARVQPFGQTAIYDALVLALDHMENARHRKRAILLITDGMDNVSRHSLDETIERIRRSDIMVYTLGLLSRSGGQRAEDILIRIAEVGGGRAFFPADVEEAYTMMQGIARDLREQYTIGYFPSNPDRDGAWRSVRVEIQPPAGFPRNLKANYRHGYYGR